VLANRVDEAGAEVSMPRLPPKLQRWWTDHARTYDPGGAPHNAACPGARRQRVMADAPAP
jgi:hypothetical protein